MQYMPSRRATVRATEIYLLMSPARQSLPEVHVHGYTLGEGHALIRVVSGRSQQDITRKHYEWKESSGRLKSTALSASQFAALYKAKFLPGKTDSQSLLERFVLDKDPPLGQRMVTGRAEQAWYPSGDMATTFLFASDQGKRGKPTHKLTVHHLSSTERLLHLTAKGSGANKSFYARMNDSDGTLASIGRGVYDKQWTAKNTLPRRWRYKVDGEVKVLSTDEAKQHKRRGRQVKRLVTPRLHLVHDLPSFEGAVPVRGIYRRLPDGTRGRLDLKNATRAVARIHPAGGAVGARHDSTGTAFMVRRESGDPRRGDVAWLMTNYHTTHDHGARRSLDFHFDLGTKGYTATTRRMVHADASRDVAVVEVQLPPGFPRDIKPLSLSRTKVRKNAGLYVVGCPALTSMPYDMQSYAAVPKSFPRHLGATVDKSRGDPWTYSFDVGGLSPLTIGRGREVGGGRIAPSSRGLRVFSMDAVTFGGNSGSPVIDERTGAVVGINTLGHPAYSNETSQQSHRRMEQARAFAVPTNEVFRSLPAAVRQAL